MMSREGDKFDNELQIVNMDDLVPRDHLLRIIDRARMEMKAGLTFACMNLKKLGMMIEMRERKAVMA